MLKVPALWRTQQVAAVIAGTELAHLSGGVGNCHVGLLDQPPPPPPPPGLGERQPLLSPPPLPHPQKDAAHQCTPEMGPQQEG